MIASTLLARISRAARRARDLLEWHPEWWMLAISVIAWLMFAASMRVSSTPSVCSSIYPGPVSTSPRFTTEYGNWLLMTLAMMLPLVVLPLRHVAFRSFRSHRNRAMAAFMVGYLAVWTVVGAAFVPLMILIAAGESGQFALWLAVMLAIAWQFAPAKTRAARRCHRTEALSASGYRAYFDCLTFGVRTGSNCAMSCWALMFVSALAMHNLLAMICIQAIMINDRYELPWASGALNSLRSALRGASQFAMAGVTALPASRKPFHL